MASPKRKIAAGFLRVAPPQILQACPDIVDNVYGVGPDELAVLRELGLSVERVPQRRSKKHFRDVLGTVALCALVVVRGGLLVAAYVWLVPMAVRLLVR